MEGEGKCLRKRKGRRNTTSVHIEKNSTPPHKSTTNKAAWARVPLLGVMFLAMTFLPVALCSTGSSTTQTTHQWTRNNLPSSRVVTSSPPPPPPPVALVEKDSMEKFSRDVATVLHVLKASEYGSDPNIPGMNRRQVWLFAFSYFSL